MLLQIKETNTKKLNINNLSSLQLHILKGFWKITFVFLKSLVHTSINFYFGYNIVKPRDVSRYNI